MARIVKAKPPRRALKTVERAWSVLTLKAISDDARELTGMATTPTPDRCDDIVEPQGAQFKLPIPLLWQHDSSKPIGEVYAAKVTPDGIEIKARLAKIEEPGMLKDRLDEAWQSIKAQLVRGLSIGFRPIEYDVVDAQNGPWGPLRHKIWEWLELSAVTIPCNAEATIETVKAFDTKQIRAASGRKGLQVVSLAPAGVSATSKSSTRPGGQTVNKLLEKLKAFRAELAKNATRMQVILEESGDETLDAAMQEEFDALEGKNLALSAHITRIDNVMKAQAGTARAVRGATGAEGSTSRGAGVADDESGDDETDDVTRSLRAAGVETRSGEGRVIVTRAAPKLAPGVAFARVIRCIGLAKGNTMQAEQIARNVYKDDHRIANILKASVVAGGTMSGNWGANLVSAEGAVFADFVEFLRPQTILGKFGTNGIPDLRRVPFNVPLVGQTGGGAGYWVGEGKPKPLTSLDFARTTLTELKVANIAVVTEELLRRSSPSVDTILRNALVEALRARLDIDFIDPTKTASAGVSPASITNGANHSGSAGSTADDVRTDIRTLFSYFIAADNAPSAAVLVMGSGTALSLGMMQNPLGQSEFPGMTINGGTLLNIPAIVSEHVPAGVIVLLNASDIYFADEGDFSVDLSREASLQMLDNPTNDSVVGTATSMVSMFQTNSVAFRAERVVDWARRRASAVAYLTGVEWGGHISP
jgi:HK97 family phage prohead protease